VSLIQIHPLNINSQTDTLGVNEQHRLSISTADGVETSIGASPGSPGKGAKTDQNVWPLPRFKNFQRHECFDDSRFRLIFSFGGNYEISVETISVETILVETNIFWWKLLLFGGN
jgi:hypothetical protein